MTNLDPIPPRPAHLHPSDLPALARLVTDLTAGTIDLVEAVHTGISKPSAPGAAGGLAPLTYRTLRGATRLVGGSVDAALSGLTRRHSRRDDPPRRRAVLAALNGLMGDYLAESGSSLALPMTFRGEMNGTPAARPARPDADKTDASGSVNQPNQRHQRATPPLHGATPQPPGDKVLLLIHGLCLNEACWQCVEDDGHRDLGLALAAELGYVPVSLSYNTGRHISSNGRELAARLQARLDTWPRPVAELVIIGHSMGGLVARSAIHYGTAAGLAWPGQLRALVCLGAPHHGAPLERHGNRLGTLMDLSPYVAPFARLGKGRSAGITDLRYGNLLDEDWHGRDRFAHGPDDTAIVPLPAGVRCYAVAATLGSPVDNLRHRLLGDGLVPLDSALGRHSDPARALAFDETWIGYGLSHQELLTRPEVVEQVTRWLS